MERTDSKTVRLLRLYGGWKGDPHVWGDFQKDNGRIVTILVRPHFQGICLAAGFVGTGGRHIR